MTDEEAPVEKFGVEEDEPSDKLGSEKREECPACHSLLRPTHETGVLLCPKCGSKPFEKAVR
jgi:hypothetical protein